MFKDPLLNQIMDKSTISLKGKRVTSFVLIPVRQFKSSLSVLVNTVALVATEKFLYIYDMNGNQLSEIGLSSPAVSIATPAYKEDMMFGVLSESQKFTVYRL